MQRSHAHGEHPLRVLEGTARDSENIKLFAESVMIFQHVVITGIIRLFGKCYDNFYIASL